MTDWDACFERCGWKLSKSVYGVWAVAFGSPQRVPYRYRSAPLALWDDHGKLYHRAADGAYMYITEPYPMDETRLAEMSEFCRDFGLHFSIHGSSIHNPGQCLHIQILQNGKYMNRDHETTPHA